MNRFPRTTLALALAAGFSHLALAQAEQNFALEEIVVTAQKRAEGLQDVPISISALSGDKLADAGINKIDDLTNYAPNLHMTESGISTQLRIRGIGSGNNQGFEQSVGQYIDGIYYGRQQLVRMPFLDLERVEVLRGPQSILFGKNSVAGALNLTSAKPTEEFTSQISAIYEPNINQREVSAYISGPLTDSLRGRLAYRSYEEDGFIENTYLNMDEPSRDEAALRATLVWDATDNLAITLKAERDTFDVTGRQIEIVQDSPSTSASPTFNGRTFSEIVQLFGEPGSEAELDGKRQADGGDFSDNQVDNTTLTVDYVLGDNTLTSVSGWVDYDFKENCDCDFVAANIFVVPTEENYKQFSQEIRLMSPSGDTLDWILGAFYQTSELDFYDAIDVPTDSLLVTLGRPLGGTSAAREFTQSSDLWAVFGQTTWNLNDDLSLTLGARYTSEKKDGTRRIDIVNTASGQALAVGSQEATVYDLGFGIESEQSTGHNLAGSRDETAFTPSINAQYRVNNDIMLYASYAKGFKAGGFDTRANNVNSFEFEEERATSVELGAKTTLADGAAELNIAWYYTQYDDLQVSQFDGVLGFNVGNAKESVVQGLELDGRWRVSEGLTLSYAMSYLDFEYVDYQNGNCYRGQTPDGVIAPWGTQLCDYTGQTGQYAPRFTVNLGLDHVLPLTDALDLHTILDTQYQDSQHIHQDLDPQYEIDGYGTVNLRLALEAEAWSLALLGKNLTDEQIMTYVGNTPLSGNFGTNTFYAFTKRPRTVALEARYRF